jgi:capsule polysaccharide export protein KpsE/RkpR
MDGDAARDYIRNYITTLKLTEKKLETLDRDLAKWKGRLDLARSRGEAALAAAAEQEAARIEAERAALAAEAAALRSQIEAMVRQLPGIAARERSVDPDLLEQELLIALGRSPGDEAALKAEAEFKRLDVEEALAALKAAGPR